MFLKKIKVSNFKSFKKLDIDFNDINILVGANGSGKTSFLDILRFVKDLYFFDFSKAIENQNGKYLKNINTLSKKITLLLELSPNSEKEIKRGETIIVYKIENIKYELNLIYNIDDDFEIENEKITFFSKFQENNIDEETDAIGEYIKDISDTYRFGIESNKGAITKFPNIKEKIKEKTSKGEDFELILENTLIENADLRNFTSRNSLLYHFRLNKDGGVNPTFKMILDYMAYDFEVKSSKSMRGLSGIQILNENGNNLIEIIRSILEKKEDAKRFNNLIKFALDYIAEIKPQQKVESSYSKNRFYFEVDEKYTKTSIPSYLLSDGTINITAIIVALFFEKSKLAIFEEPDNGIHPALMERLMKMFFEVSEKKQILLTTHNPEIVRYTNLNDLLLISRNNKDGFSEIIEFSENKTVIDLLQNEDETIKNIISNVITKNLKNKYEQNQLEYILNELFKPEQIHKLKLIWDKMSLNELFVLDLLSELK